MWRRSVGSSKQNLIWSTLHLTCIPGSGTEDTELLPEQDGNSAFPLESVKKMKEILGKEAKAGPASVRSQSPVTFLRLCLNPELPKDLRPVCDREDAPAVFRRLELAVEDPDLCELCVNAACTGCS
ncbi:guanylin-like isoform X1 [Paroedura picta]|uniref:guanylin-like isoform X1 n=1 Tax=Paroedura picta TaxID=143630 RepID=UPI0040560D14